MGPAAGLLGFGAGLGAGMPGAPPGSHASVSNAHPLLKSADLHTRESVDIKSNSANTDERLVRDINIITLTFAIHFGQLTLAGHSFIGRSSKEPVASIECANKKCVTK